MESIGKYHVIRELGKGATAVVYLCQDPDIDRQLAVKVVQFTHKNVAVSRRLRKLFRTERMISERLNHPNIVRVYDAEVQDNQAYIAMEYVDGVSLEEFCHIDNLLPLHRTIGIIFKCCMALDHAYHHGVIHRDIKPANILVDKEDNPKIADFGLAININKDMDRDSTFVMGVGSPAYMSPEQIKAYPLNQKTDLYSLGVVLFQMLTGRLPFRAQDQATLVYKIMNMDPPVASHMNPNVPAKLDIILKKALEKNLYSRYSNGAEFAKELSSVRYKIMSDNEDYARQDNEHFSALRKLEFFLEFENVELWEILRSAVWRNIDKGIAVMREGEEDRRFGILVAGQVEVSCEGKVLCRLGAGEIVGEMAYLSPEEGKRGATVVTLEPCRFVEISGPALAMASDELQERMRNALTAKIITRLRAANRRLLEAKEAVDALSGSAPPQGDGSLKLELAP
ncbi:MAG: protein kinase [Zoogloeaceae bacterium]|jgi:tRNA A-37 threonylcarbamoyl transferase component Bud32|nr:protein kinase [Zoogloeaceae bacterium]